MASLLSSVFTAGCSVFGYRGGTEEPHYAVVSRVGPVEIRRYGRRAAADTIVDADDVERARSQGFKILAGYIFGDNQGSEKIAMTAPVAQSSRRIAMTAPVSQSGTGAGWRIRFFLPDGLTAASAPEPNSDAVRLTTVPAADYAILRFSGSRDEAAVQAHIERLETALEDSRWRTAGEPVAWFYDPPWTLSVLRRNEVAVAVRGDEPT